MREPKYIIAIGASAGGLEEINTFFDHTPLDSVSYIIVQHLSSDFKSRMTELLSKHSKLSVQEATDGATVECNNVYLIPNDKFMTISKSKLLLQQKHKTDGPHLTINTFFESLAADCGKKAIGIILSGFGNDGSDGAIAIKENGGMVIARNPENSAFPSMPSKAIATGMVDYILEPSLMPDAIEDYVKYEAILSSSTEDDEIPLEHIIELIGDRSPLDFSNYKPSTIMRRTKRRAAYNNFGNLKSYFEFLKDTPSEIELLSKDFMISVTAFFRDAKAFEYLKKNVIPELIKKLLPKEELKIWVPGCATGEEVYSLAILISEQLEDVGEDLTVKIFATDIDNRALLHAGKGVYSKDAISNISEERIAKYFTLEGDGYRVKQQLRKMAIFARHDLVKNPPYCNMHLISCRNLLIYMAPILQKKIFAMMLFGLKQEGYLFLGSSENPMAIIKDLEVVSKQYKIYKNLKSKRSVSFDAFSMPETIDARQRSTSVSSSLPGDNNAALALSDIMHENLAHALNYLVLCIDENQNVIKSYGNSSKFLLPKHFETNLGILLPKKLAMVYHSLRNKVLKSNENLTLYSIKLKLNDELIRVNLSLSPLSAAHGEKLIMVTLSEDHSLVPLTPEVNEFEETRYNDEYTRTLEEELKVLKEKLNTAYEQLNASNENMQSFNEEMISANEEMQSTNEEMQSVNEELDTINTDHQLKNRELAEINDDLNNYFRSNINGQLFVNKHLLLMKFSPGTVKQINLQESDIGRPLSHITTNIKFETIIEDVQTVLAKDNIITKEIETNNGKWYQVMTMPYFKQSDKKNTGAIITFNDITALKKVQKALNLSNKMLGMAIDVTGTGTWAVNVASEAFSASERLKLLFGFSKDQEMNIKSVVSKIREEFRDTFEHAYEATIKTGAKFDLEFPILANEELHYTWIRAIGSLSRDQDGKAEYFTGVMNDITVHREDELMKNDFIAMVSHELRLPLTTLQGYIQLLVSRAEKSDWEFTSTALEKANVQIKKMTALINGFLNVSSLEAGKIQLVMEIFEINTLVQETIDELLFLTPTHNLIVRKGPLCQVNADREKIGQVITNFISNAIKYNVGNAPVEIEISCNEEMVQVCISDKGIGIAVEDQTRLFERYYRIKSKATDSISGFGLGLYLSGEIIKCHHGKVWVESERGKGASFFFSLPLN